MNDAAIFRVGDIPEHDISLQDFKHPMIFSQNIEESCTFQKIWPGRLEKNTDLLENHKEIN